MIGTHNTLNKKNSSVGSPEDRVRQDTLFINRRVLVNKKMWYNKEKEVRMSQYDIKDAYVHAVNAANRLCDEIGRTHFQSSDPDSELNWETVKDPNKRAKVYTHFTQWLITDAETAPTLDDKVLALNTVVNALVADLARLAPFNAPVVVAQSMEDSLRICTKNGSFSNLQGLRYHVEQEELDARLNIEAVVYAAQQYLIANEQTFNALMLTNPPRLKM